MRNPLFRTLLVTMLAAVAMLVLGAGQAMAAGSGSPGDPTIVVPVNDDTAGGTYDMTFKLVYDDATPTGTPVYIYVPQGWSDGATEDANGDPIPLINPLWDPNTSDDFTPCAQHDPADYVVTQEQIDIVGDTLANQIVGVNEAHFGPIGLADASDPDSDALVVLVYNDFDDYYYDCSETVYTAGYFAPGFIEDPGMNVIVVDNLDWALSVDAGTDESDDFIISVVAHELEHLLMEYSDKGELSWVDEGLADFAMFLNGFPTSGSHLTYHQVFHRETSLTRWGGGLENYGASLSFMLYLWEQAGGNGDGTFNPDKQYDNAGGDLLIKLIFQNQEKSTEGVQAAIDAFNAAGHPGLDEPLRSLDELYKDFVVALYLDTTTADKGDRFVFRNLDFGNPGNSTAWTIDLANDVFFKHRGIYTGAIPNTRWANQKRVPEQLALPFGASYETFRNVGKSFSLFFDGSDSESIAPHSAPTHWYGGYESANENILNVASAGTAPGAVVDFWTWYFIEDEWDYGFVEACVGGTGDACTGGTWQTVPLYLAGTTTEVTHPATDDPHGNNTEGNGLTGTSGGTYFVDDPTYIHLQSAPLPAGTTDVRFRYSTDAAYLDTGWFVDDVTVGGQAATLSSAPGNWTELTADVQDNNWVVQIISPCDLTPGQTTEGEIVDPMGYVYRFEGDLISTYTFNTSCLHGTQDSFAVAISNLPTGSLTVLDANYLFRINGTTSTKVASNFSTAATTATSTSTSSASRTTSSASRTFTRK
jgi:hypothetical protein